MNKFNSEDTNENINKGKDKNVNINIVKSNLINFDRIYYEKEILEYNQGKEILDMYNNIPKIEINSHNNIEELRKYENKDFTKLKKYLILGIRKTHKYTENHKTSDYLVPFTSSGCSAMCLYCYLVCNYNKCSYLRIFLNKEEMMNRISRKILSSEKELTLEIGSNSDLLLENLITGNLKWTIEKFTKLNKGYLTFPTKFHFIDDILDIDHKGRIIVRMSVNPDYIISKVELLTSSLKDRVEAINKLAAKGYKIGILVAPVIMVDNYKELYLELIEYLKNNLSDKAKEIIFFEVIFMTYSFVHNEINKEAFPKAIKIFDKEKMKGRGRGKYMYKNDMLTEGKSYIEFLLKSNFPKNDIKYIV